MELAGGHGGHQGTVGGGGQPTAQNKVTLTGSCLLAAGVARLSSEVSVVQQGGGEHQGEQVEEVVVAGEDDEDLQ